MKEATIHNQQIGQMRERCKANENFFASFIDVVPPRVYLNPDDRTNWIKILTSDSKRKKSLSQNGVPNGKHTNGVNGVTHSEESEEEEEDMEMEYRYNRFDPKFFKTVSQILKDFEMYQKNKKTIPLKLNLNRTKQNKENSVNQSKSTAIKVQNKSQNKKANKENAEEQTEEAQSGSDATKSSSEKKGQKRVSKFKEEKREAIKRQRLRYDSQSETQIVNIDHMGANSTEKARKPILNKNGEVVYSKFDFTADKTIKTKKNKDDKLTVSNAKPKDYKKLLKKLQEKREKVEELKQTEPEKANEMELKSKWKSAIDKAAGVKVKDDVNLLKKAVKRMEKKKDKSKKNWDERVKSVEERKNKAQEKRRKNLEKRKEKNKERKINKLKKKGRILPGF